MALTLAGSDTTSTNLLSGTVRTPTASGTPLPSTTGSSRPDAATSPAPTSPLTAVRQNSGSITLTLPTGNVSAADLARLLSDVLALNRDTTGGQFEQYALALSGLNGPATGDPVAIEATTRTVIETASKTFEPAKQRWVVGEVPASYLVQLRDLTTALLHRLEATSPTDSAVRTLQVANLQALGAAYQKLNDVRFPRARDDEYKGTVKIAKWEGSFWKDTYACYVEYSYDSSAIRRLQGVGGALAALAMELTPATPASHDKLTAVTADVAAYADTADAVNKTGLRETSKSYKRKIAGWND